MFRILRVILVLLVLGILEEIVLMGVSIMVLQAMGISKNQGGLSEFKEGELTVKYGDMSFKGWISNLRTDYKEAVKEAKSIYGSKNGFIVRSS